MLKDKEIMCFKEDKYNNIHQENIQVINVSKINLPGLLTWIFGF